MTGSACEEPRTADIGCEADDGFGHPDHRALGDDAMRAMRREPDAAAQAEAVHERDIRLRVARDHRIEPVFGAPERTGNLGPRRDEVINGPDVAAGAKGLSAGAVDDDMLDAMIIAPLDESRGDGLDHGKVEGVERLGPVERDAACGTFDADENV